MAGRGEAAATIVAVHPHSRGGNPRCEADVVALEHVAAACMAACGVGRESCRDGAHRPRSASGHARSFQSGCDLGTGPRGVTVTENKGDRHGAKI